MRDMSYEESFDFGDANEDFDAIYDNAEEHDVGNVQQEHGSVLVHLLSQVLLDFLFFFSVFFLKYYFCTIFWSCSRSVSVWT